VRLSVLGRKRKGSLHPLSSRSRLLPNSEWTPMLVARSIVPSRALQTLLDALPALLIDTLRSL
jgi:hypothetical protein